MLAHYLCSEQAWFCEQQVNDRLPWTMGFIVQRMFKARLCPSAPMLDLRSACLVCLDPHLE